ncbi:hypothetical protein QTP81_04355 [Alteromonas sp. ASW11-36]|uniref:PEP-CTERM sorting domain-containing protein n=1 Tax=Alteromonas arenosi TaxID=3055817 RepID=A0ABT7SUH8_9ALTE|nr:hypothetical protein [Alteromonas sp. ASW11-36]MDM7859831.1 hypothetical protein [Alteromonas sp. ASW11-36]
MIRSIKRFIAISVLLAVPSLASAGLIVDLAVEAEGPGSGLNGWISDGGWYSYPGSAEPFFGEIKEGNWITHSNNNGVRNSDVSQGAHTLQQGLYTIYFAAGNYNNVPFAFQSFNLFFAGMSVADAIQATSVTPALGGWELWSFTWSVGADNVNIGNALSFSISAANYPGSGANAAIDGVGNLMRAGNGFLVDYSAANVSEPAIAPLLALSILLMWSRQRRRKMH